MAKQLIAKPNLTAKEIVTLEHSLQLLNHFEILDVLKQQKITINENIRKKRELEKVILKLFVEGNIPKRVFKRFRERAFNPELNVTDGFYLSFPYISKVLSKDQLIRLVEKFNNEIDEFQDVYGAEVEIFDYENRMGKFLFTRKKETYAYDRTSMFSTKFQEEQKILVEINFVQQTIYFQTSNIVKFRSIRTVVQDFLSIIFDLDEIKLYPPKMSQQLNFTLSEDGKTATRYEGIHTNTIKLLDLLLELNNDSSKFSEFECVEITLDHEDSRKKNTKAKINTQAFGGGDLLGTKEVNDLVLQGRIILEVDFKIVYNEPLKKGEFRKHTIKAGITNDSREFLRIYIHNNDKTLKLVIDKAYKDLKSVFIEHSSAKELRNEEKLKNILGLR